MIENVSPQKHKRRKRHHFVSVTYMNGFCGPDNRIHAYRAEDPAHPLHVEPRTIGYQNYYYSQPLPNGSRDDDQFEELWSKFETLWPQTLAALQRNELGHAVSFNALGLATIMRTRVPAAREFHETLMATKLRLEVQGLAAIGRLPDELQRYIDELDTVPVGIAPQRTIGTMVDDMRDFGDLCFKIGFEVIHNRSGIHFLTSDNPVCYFDPTASAHLYNPYDVERDIEFYFPLDATTLLRGSHKLRPVNCISRHRVVSDRTFVRRVNRTVAKFSYRLLLADSRSNDALALRYADTAPIAKLDISGPPTAPVVIYRHAFGVRPELSQYIDTPEKAARLEAKIAAKRLGPCL